MSRGGFEPRNLPAWGRIKGDLYKQQDLLDVFLENGFDNQSDSTISFDDGTRTFTITPVGGSFSFNCHKTRHTKTAAESIQISDVEGLHFIYYDVPGVLVETTTFTDDIILNFAFVALVYWDATNSIHLTLADERHGNVMDSTTHLYHHNTEGTVYESGLAPGNLDVNGNGDDASAAQLSVTSGVIWDEDLSFNIPVANVGALIPVFYKSGATGAWRKIAGDGFIGTTAGLGGRAVWNNPDAGGAGVWGLTEVDNNDFYLMHLFATDDVDDGFFWFMGQGEYNTTGQARDGAVQELLTLNVDGMPTVEYKAVATFIMQTSNGYTNTPKSRVRSTDSGDDYVDWRSINTGISISLVAGSVTNWGDIVGDILNQVDLQASLALKLEDITGENFNDLADVNVGTPGAPEDGYSVVWDNATGMFILSLVSGGGGGLSNIVEDATPQLGGSLDVNGQDIVSVSAGAIRLVPDTTGEIQLVGAVRIGATAMYRDYSSADTDITGLISGSAYGSLIEGRSTGHMVIGIRENGADDVFAVISGSGNYTTDTTYDKRILQIRADGDTELQGNLNLLGTLDVAVIETENGSQSLPAITSKLDPDTGIYWTNDNNIRFSTAGALRLSIEANGTVRVPTGNYETLVTEDDDIPNKKYVDDAIAGGGGGGLNNVVEDTTPELGGLLDMLGNEIRGTGNPATADQWLQLFGARWNGTQVAFFGAKSGSDTVNKDSGELVFSTYSAAGVFVEAMRLLENGNISVGQNVDFGTGKHIIGDFGAASRNDRPSIISDVAGNTSVFQVRPNATGANAFVVVTDINDVENAAGGIFGMDATGAFVDSNTWGTGTQKPLALRMDGTTSINVRTDRIIEFWDSMDIRNSQIYGDFGNLTIASRPHFRNSVGSSSTIVPVAPSSGGVGSFFLANADGNVTDSPYIAIGISSLDGYITTGAWGAGVERNFAINTNATTRQRILTTGQIIFGDSAADALGVQAGAVTISTGNSGVTGPHTLLDDLIVESDAGTGITIASPNTLTGHLGFADPEHNFAGLIRYSHTTNVLDFFANGLQAMAIDSAARMITGSVTSDCLGAQAGSITIATANSGVTSPNANADELMLEGSGDVGITIASPASQAGRIHFADPIANNSGVIKYSHSTDILEIFTNVQLNVAFHPGGQTSFGVNTLMPLGVTAGSVTISTADSGISGFNANGDELCIEGTGHVGLSIISDGGVSSSSRIFFGDATSNNTGLVVFDHQTEALTYYKSGLASLTIDSTRRLYTGGTPDIIGVTAGALTVSTGNSGQAVANTGADDLIVESDGDAGITIACPNTNIGRLNFADAGANNRAAIFYDHNSDQLKLRATAVNRLVINSDGSLSVSGTTNYETLVTHDDDIPNKKYVDDNSGSGMTAGTAMTVDPATSGGSSTHTPVAHGLGGKPKRLDAYLECKTAQHGYAVGDQIHIDSYHDGFRGITISANATNIYVAITNSIYMCNRTTGAAALATNANWKLVVTPYI